MESNAGTTETRSNLTASDGGEVTTFESLQFTDEIHRLILAPTTDNASSFTALLELPPTQAVELLHSPDSPKLITASLPNVENSEGSFRFPSNTVLIERDARFSVFSGEANHSNEKRNSPESKNVTANLEKNVKSEPAETESSQPTVEKRSIKRKDRENKVKGSTKKSKTAANESSEHAEKLPYVHVRARRGQATDSHSLAERARREKINARMKLLQELVPGCNKSGSLMDTNFPSLVMPAMWPEVQGNGHKQQYQHHCHFDALQQPVRGREEVCNNYITPENLLLTYDSSTNSATLQANQLKMEL